MELCSLRDEFEEYYDEETIDLFDDVFCIQWSCDSIVVLNPDAYEIIETPAAWYLWTEVKENAMKAAADKEAVYQKFTGDSYVVEVEKNFLKYRMPGRR